MISYEEYYPYGRSAYRAAASGVDLSLKRYRFTGKERDEETGLDYFGVRYYASWLGRWTSGDPGGFVDGLNLYRYTRNNPVNGIDREGYSTEGPGDPPKKGEPTNPLGEAADEIVVTADRPNSKVLFSAPTINMPQDILVSPLNESNIIIDTSPIVKQESVEADPVPNGTAEEGYGQGDIRIYNYKEWHGNVETTRTKKYAYHEGNEYLEEEGWYDYNTYLYGNLDYNNGQVMLPLSEMSKLEVVSGIIIGGARSYTQDGLTYRVDDMGYIDLENPSVIAVAEMPWWLSFGRNPKSIKDAAKSFKKLKPSIIAPSFRGNVRHIVNYNKTLLALQNFVKSGGKPKAIIDKVWKGLSSIEQKKFKTALQKGVVGTEGQKGLSGIIKLKDKDMLSRGYTHKLKIGNSDKRIYGRMVDGKWDFNFIRGHKK